MGVGYRDLVLAWNDRHITTLPDALLDPFNVRLQLDTAEFNPDTEIEYPENAPSTPPLFKSPGHATEIRGEIAHCDEPSSQPRGPWIASESRGILVSPREGVQRDRKIVELGVFGGVILYQVLGDGFVDFDNLISDHNWRPYMIDLIGTIQPAICITTFVLLIMRIIYHPCFSTVGESASTTMY